MKHIILFFLLNQVIYSYAAGAEYELRVGHSISCPVTGGASSAATESTLEGVMVKIGEVALGKIAEATVDWAVKIMTPDEKKLTFQGSYDGYFKKVNGLLGFNNSFNCLIVIAGKFDESGSDESKKLSYIDAPLDADPSSFEERIGKLIPNLQESPAFYMEAERVFSIDKSALRWKIKHVQYDKLLSTHLFAGKARDLVLTVSLKSVTDEVLTSFSYSLENKTPPYKYSINSASALGNGSWQLINAVKNTPKMKDDIDQYFPFNVSAELVESPKVGVFTSEFLNSVEKHKQEIKDALRSSIVPSLKEDANEKRINGYKDALSSYLDKLGKFKENCASIDTTSPQAQQLDCAKSRQELSSLYSKNKDAVNYAKSKYGIEIEKVK